MKNLQIRRSHASAVAAATLVAACFGGGDDDGPTPPVMPPVVSGTDVPVSATNSSTGAFAFVSSVAAAASESAEPLTVGDAVLATSETDEPDPSV